MLAFGRTQVDARNQRLKIVHVETGRNFYGGAQQVIWLIRGLADRGVDSLLVCPPGSAIDGVARAADMKVSNIACSGDADFAFPFRLRRFLRIERPDIVHCHSRRGADFPGGWGALAAQIPAVVSRRVDSPESPTAARIRYRPFRKIIAISENIATVLGTSWVRPERLTVIRSAVDANAVVQNADRAILEREFGMSKDSYAIAVVAQLIKRKGHRFLLDVLPGLLAEHPSIKVVFFGAGNAEAQLRALAKKLGCSGAVHFAGFRHDLDDYLSAFDLLVHPAEKEGLGVAMLKASAAGLPVIAFDIAGSREAVQHLKTGILVPPGDVTALQAAIGTLYDEPDIRAELGAAGRKRMEEDFSVSTMVERYIAVYNEVLNA
jgi:glycosyltransferase involved in cell wall biosynthesis